MTYLDRQGTTLNFLIQLLFLVPGPFPDHHVTSFVAFFEGAAPISMGWDSFDILL